MSVDCAVIDVSVAVTRVARPPTAVDVAATPVVALLTVVSKAVMSVDCAVIDVSVDVILVPSSFLAVAAALRPLACVATSDVNDAILTAAAELLVESR